MVCFPLPDHIQGDKHFFRKKSPKDKKLVMIMKRTLIKNFFFFKSNGVEYKMSWEYDKIYKNHMYTAKTD